MKNTIFASLTGLFALTATAQADTLRMLSSWPQNQLYNVNVTAHFIEKVQELSGGELEIALDGPDVVPPLDQIEPVQAGVFDMLLTHPAYHVGTTTIGLGIEGTLPDATLRRSSGVFDTLDAHYQSVGLKVVSVVPFGSVAFNFILKEPITEAPSFDGRKLRGTPFLNPVIEGLGAAPVTMPMPDVYTSLQTGVIEGASATMVGIKEQKWDEVAGYFSRPGFGTASLFVLMNLDAWNGLSDAQKAVFEDAATYIETTTSERIDALIKTEEEALIAAGMQVTEFPAEDAARLNSLLYKGAWALASKSGPLAEKMKEQAIAVGLTE